MTNLDQALKKEGLGVVLVYSQGHQKHPFSLSEIPCGEQKSCCLQIDVRRLSALTLDCLQNGADENEIRAKFDFPLVILTDRYRQKVKKGGPFLPIWGQPRDGLRAVFGHAPARLLFFDPNTRQPVWEAIK